MLISNCHLTGLTGVSQPTLFQTPFHSPQLELFELDDEQWLKVYQRPYQARKRPLTLMAKQLTLFNLAASAVMASCFILAILELSL
jgi:hypothetical protein